LTRRRTLAPQAVMREKLELEQQRMKQAVKKMLNRQISTAWGRWLELHDTVARMKKITRRMMNRCAVGAFDRWLEMTYEAQEMRAKMNKVALRIKHIAVAGAFVRWAEMAQEAKEQRVLLERVVRVPFEPPLSRGLELRLSEI
jgi:hypothetical protein